MALTASIDDLDVEVSHGRVWFALADGTPLGIGFVDRVAPAIEDALAHLDETRGVVDGVAVRGVCTFDISDTDLAVGRVDGRVVLIWRDPHGSVVGRVELEREDVDDLLAQLHDDRSPASVDRPGWRESRTALLQALADVTDSRRHAEDRGAGSDEIRAITARWEDLRGRYVHGLPQVPVARDPADDSRVTVALDNAGLDGPYWDAENPARPAEAMGASFVVLSGAMRLAANQIENTPHLCLPGPEVPFVVPALLGRDGVKAVMATVRIGPHTGYTVTYFSPNPSESSPLPNEWGRREYWLRDHGRPLRMDASYDTHPAPDFNLAPWINAGKLGWIAPGDAAMRVRWVADRCRYLMPGSRQFQRVRGGSLS